jgi:membrane-associated protein
MRYRVFVTYNVLGALLWAVGVTTLGYLLGTSIPNIDRYLLPVIMGIIALSVLPIAVEILRSQKRSRRD